MSMSQNKEKLFVLIASVDEVTFF